MDVAILSIVDKSKSGSKSYFDDWKTLQKLKQLQQVKLVGTIQPWFVDEFAFGFLDF